MGGRWLAATLAGGLALASAPGRADELGPLFLASVAVDGPGELAAGQPVEVTLELHPGAEAKAESLREWFPEAKVVDGRVTLRLVAEPVGVSPPTEAQRRPSFLVDFDEPPVAALRERLAKELGPHPDDAALATFVDGFITHKSMRRLVDPASVVARRREGDCSEHAVLLAALARLVGRPARVVLGVALLPLTGRVVAAGHAWAELHDGTRWHEVDAVTLPDGARHLPLMVVVDEGPGHLLAQLERLSPFDLRRLTLGPAPAGAAPGR
jgi:hypothetical protein